MIRTSSGRRDERIKKADYDAGKIPLQDIDLGLAGKRLATVLNTIEGGTGWAISAKPAIETIGKTSVLIFKAANAESKLTLAYPVLPPERGSTAIYINPQNYDACWTIANCTGCIYYPSTQSCSCNQPVISSELAICSKKHPRIGDHGFPYLLNPNVWGDDSDKAIRMV